MASAVAAIASALGGARSNPNTKSTVTIGDNVIHALGVHFGVHNQHDYTGMPQMGSLACTIDITVDMHDVNSMSFGTIRSLFGLVNGVDSTKIQDCKIEYWIDETMQDAICVFVFRAWVTSFSTSSTPGTNHTLMLSLQPELDQGKFIKIDIQN